MLGDEREPPQVVVATRLTKGVGDPPVEEPAASQAEALVRQEAKARVAEVVARLGARRRRRGLIHLADQTAPLQLFEGGDRFLLGPSARLANETERRRAADHRGR